MRISKIAVLLIIFASLASTLPDAYAQTTTIADLHYPFGVVAGSPDPIFVTATVSYRNAGHSYLLVVGIVDMGGTPQTVVPGIATSSPDQCAFQPTLSAFCIITPHNSSGPEHVEFKIGGILGRPLPEGNWKLNMTAALLTSNRTIVENSASSALFTITVSSMILTVKIPAAITVTVDGMQQSPGPIQLPISAGPHTISVPSTAQVDNTTRLRFDGWADGFAVPNRTVTIEMSRSYEAVYVTQYRLAVIGEAVSATGQGWYDAGSIATFSVAETEPMGGILGLLGGKLGFQGWYEGNQLLADSSTSMIIMDKPHTLTVNWQADYTIPLIISGVVLIALGLAYFAIRHRNSTRRGRPAKRARSR